MKIDVVKSKIWSSDIEVFIQNSDGLCASYFHHMIKTYTWWGLLSVIVDVRLILKITNYVTTLIYLYLYQYLLLWDILYIIGNGLISTFQYKFNCMNLFSHSWDIIRQSFYSYWWPDISVICCCVCTSSYICK